MKVYNKIVLIIIDTLGYDCLTENGGKIPWFNGLSYKRAFSTSGWTLPSVASILTGKFCHEHRSYNHVMPISKDCLMIQEIFKKNGYLTAGIFNNYNFDPEIGFDRGFDQYIYIKGFDHHNPFHVYFELINELNKCQKYFLVFHTNMVHNYFMNDPIYDSNEIPIDIIKYLLGDKRMLQTLPEQFHYVVRKRYEKAVYETAMRLQKCLRHINLNETLCYIVSDHGEGLQLPRIHHGGRLHNDLVHVPLTLLNEVGENNHLFSLIQLKDEILYKAGLRKEPSKYREIFMEDRGYFYINGESISDNYRLDYSTVHDIKLQAHINWPLKYISASVPSQGYYWKEIYNIQDDPDEKNNLCNNLPFEDAFVNL